MHPVLFLRSVPTPIWMGWPIWPTTARKPPTPDKETTSTGMTSGTPATSAPMIRPMTTMRMARAAMWITAPAWPIRARRMPIRTGLETSAIPVPRTIRTMGIMTVGVRTRITAPWISIPARKIWTAMGPAIPVIRPTPMKTAFPMRGTIAVSTPIPTRPTWMGTTPVTSATPTGTGMDSRIFPTIALFSFNPGQEDQDGDSTGNLADPDIDGDLVANAEDNCPWVVNADQADFEGDGTGDLCDSDRDGDGAEDSVDNCPSAWNPGQEDADEDDTGDTCEDEGIPQIAVVKWPQAQGSLAGRDSFEKTGNLLNSRWRISTADGADFDANVIWEVTLNQLPLTEVRVLFDQPLESGLLFARVAYRDSTGWSAESSTPFLERGGSSGR